MKKNKDKKIIYLLAGILLIGLFLRIYRLGYYSFWYDEALSITLARINPITYFQHYISYMIDPPLFHLLLHFWSYLGKSEFVLRSFSLIFGIISIVLVYKVGERLFNKRAGLIGAFMLALSPLNIYYSQELRCYSLLLFLTLLSTHFFIKLLKKNEPFSWIGYIIATLLCLYTHYSAFFFIFAQNCFFFFFFKQHKRIINKWIGSNFIILGLYLPWIKVLIKQIIFGVFTKGLIAWMSKGSLRLIMQTFKIFNMGYNASHKIQLLALLLFMPIIVFTFLRWKKNGKNLCLLVFLILIPMFTVTLISHFISIYSFRIFIYCSPFYYLILAYGIDNIRSKTVRVALMSFFIILVFFPIQNYYRNFFPSPEKYCREGVHPKHDYRGAAEYLKKRYSEDAIIVYASPSAVHPFFYYLGCEEISHYSQKMPFQQKTSEFTATCLLTENVSANYKIMEQNEFNNHIRGYKKVWLILSDWDIRDMEELKKLGKRSYVKKWIESEYNVREYGRFEGVVVYLYIKAYRISSNI